MGKENQTMPPNQGRGEALPAFQPDEREYV